jgi:putative DNA methylase
MPAPLNFFPGSDVKTFIGSARGSTVMTRSPDLDAKCHTRGYLPHIDIPWEPQLLTFRLHDSLPREFLALLSDELQHLKNEELHTQRSLQIEEYLDRGAGSCALSDPQIARMTEQAINHFDGDRYRIHAWVIMPNHVHVLLTPFVAVDTIVHSWKSFTANRANSILGAEGTFWQREYFDRMIRNESHFYEAIAYIHNNPVKAGLCADPASYSFSSARSRK